MEEPKSVWRIYIPGRDYTDIVQLGFHNQVKQVIQLIKQLFIVSIPKNLLGRFWKRNLHSQELLKQYQWRR